MGDHMKYVSRFVLAGLVSVLCAGSALAQEGSVMSLTLMPIQTSFVKGDVQKFRAVNWITDGSQSGIKDLRLDAKAAKDLNVIFEGRGMPGDEDYIGSMAVTKEGVGFIKTEYKGFRKYFDGMGGFFPYDHLSINDLNKELALDMGHFSLEVGRGTPEDSPLSLLWERDTKKGDKSRLSWAQVRDTVNGAIPSQLKYTAPSWENLDETTDKLTLRGKGKFLGFNLKGAQTYEFSQADTYAAVPYIGYPVANDTYNKTRTVSDDMQTKQLTTNILAERWTLNEKTYLSFGYLYSHTRNTDIQYQKEYNVLGVWTTANSPKNNYGHSLAIKDTNTWTGQILTNITPTLVFISKGKAELMSLHSSAEQQAYTSPLPTLLAATDKRDEQNEILTAEAFSLRYSGIAKTSLYSELEMAQANLNQNMRKNTGAANFFVYDEKAPEIVGTLGARIVPIKGVSLTSEYKHSEKGMKAKDQLNDNTFIANMLTVKDDASIKLSWKPIKWLENGLRVSQAENKYHTQVYAQDWLKAQGSERNFSYDLTLMPTDELMFNASYALQLLKSSTPAAQIKTGGGLPGYTGNVYTTSVGSSYAPNEKFSIFNNISYSMAQNGTNNYPDLNSTGPAMQYGFSDQWYSADVGAKLEVKKNVSVEPHYSYYAFRSNPEEGVNYGNYSAHVVWFDVNMKW